MAAQLRIQLLGSFAVLLDEQSIHGFRSAKARALLAFLAAQPEREHPRSLLAALFWGDLPDAAAMTNLRVELSNLKKLLGDHPALVITRTTARVDTLLARVDVVAFHESVAAVLALPAEMQLTQLYRLSRALDVYGGEFLAGFHLDDCPEFEDWQRDRREQLHEWLMQALETLQIRYAEQARWDELSAAARRQLAVQPWHEAAHRRLIHALAAQGQIQAALHQYDVCCTMLRLELGGKPSPETEALVARLRQQRLPSPVARHNLPLRRRSFVGRTAEIDRLRLLVARERLVTLLGIGGVGKSSLAQAVVQDMLGDFVHGVWFVALANIAAADNAHQQIALAIAAAIGFPVTDMQTPLAELTNYLADKPLLLVLDNWDHLTGCAADLFDPLLEQTPVHVLATSRAALHVDGEIIVRLEGLPASDGFALFVDRAQRIVPDFNLEGDLASQAAIAQICAQVAGLPLGIELAASWVEHFSAEEICRSVTHIEIEPERKDELVARHHKASRIFEYSWQLLGPAQQQILARLSVFRGGFDREAAIQMAESTLSDLSILISHSLLQRMAAGRYDLHPLIQEFAREKLSAAEAAVLDSRHSRHYLTLLVAAARSERTPQLRSDLENIRCAWQSAVHREDAALIGEALVAFGELMARYGLMTDAEALFQAAVAAFEPNAAHAELVARLLEQQIAFTQSMSGHAVLIPLKQRILALTVDPSLQTKAHTDLAYYYAEAGQWEASDRHFEQAEALTQAADLRLYISAVESRIHTNALHYRGDFVQSIDRLQQMLTLLDTLSASAPHSEPTTEAGRTPLSKEESDLRSRLLQSLGIVALRYGDYALAIRSYQQNLDWISTFAHQQRRTGALLNLALAESYAGQNEIASAHNREALTLAEEIGAVFYTSLLKINLCLTLRFCGRLEESLAFGLTASDTLKTLKMSRLEAQGRNRVGHTLLAMRCWPDADVAYAQALSTWAQIPHPYRYEAVAGRAVAAFHLQRADEALAGVAETLSFVEGEGLQRITEPILLLLNCEEVLRGVGQAERALQVLHWGEAWARTIAGRISDERVRASFLARPDHQELLRRLYSEIRFRPTQTPTVTH